MTEFPALSIIIVNWKSVNFTRKCLASVHVHAKDINLEILVVDNASFDGCAEMIKAEFPEVRFIQSHDNLGFARANNLAFEHSSGSILLFLNPDTEIVGMALQDMMACLELIPEAGIAGPKLLNSDLSVQTSCLQSFPSILNQMLDAECLRSMFPKSSLWGNRALFEGNCREVSVEGISGACLMIKRNVFESAGLFTPDYFMYGEDMDLCRKVKEAGWMNYYVSSSTVIHYGGQSTHSRSENHFSAVMMKESLYIFMRAHYGILYARLFKFTVALTALCRMSALAFATALPSVVFRKHSLSPAFAKWLRVFRWAIGLESWAKRSI